MAINQRYLTIDNGHMILTGNTLMIYQDDIANGGPFITTNTALQVPGYPVGTTLNWQDNSSMAVLTIPPTATVLYAELTWTSLLIAGAVDYSAFANDPVEFTTPVGLTPVAVQFNDLTNSIATRSADVTALVQAGGTGQYTVGRIAGVNGIESTGITGNAAGWYLSVIVHDPAETSKLFQINVGNIFVPAQSQIDFTISGFSTPASGSVTGRLFAGIQRGDPVVDNITIFTGPDTGSLTYQLTRPPMPDDNMIAGFISNTETGALIDTSGSFGTSNNIPGNPPVAQPNARWHIDIAAFDISASLLNNQSSLVTRSISNGSSAVFDYNVYNVQIEAQSASLASTKTVSSPFAKIGDILTYTIVITNSGTIQADNVVLTDAIPEGTSFVAGSVVGATGTPPTLTLTSPILPGDSATVTFQVQVDTIPTQNPISNTVDVSYTFVPIPGGTPIAVSETSNPAITQVNTANVSIVKTADPIFSDVDGIITYTLTLQNTGNVSANNVIISDVIPTGTVFVPGSVTGATGTPPTLSIPFIAAGASSVVTFKVMVAGEVPNPNPIENSASSTFTYTMDPANPNGVTGSAISGTVTTQVNTANVIITKKVDKNISYIGDIVTYQIAIENTGNVSADNVILTDVLPYGVSFVNGSLIGSVAYSGTLASGIVLTNPIPANQIVTFSFQIKVDEMPNPNPIENNASLAYAYTVDPQFPDAISATALSNTVKTLVFRFNFNQQIIDLIESVALEQAAVAAIAQAEGAKIQKLVAMGNVTAQELICINKSVSDMMDSLSLLEMLLKQKLEIVNCQINGTEC